MNLFCDRVIVLQQAKESICRERLKRFLSKSVELKHPTRFVHIFLESNLLLIICVGTVLLIKGS